METKFTVDLSQEGLAMLFKDYQEVAMKLLWNTDNLQSSRDVWIHVNKQLESTGGRNKSKYRGISRASIINFCNAMVEEGALAFSETTGKGGHRRLYYAELTEEQLWAKLTGIVHSKFP